MEIVNKNLNGCELPQGLINDAINIATHAYNEFRPSFDMDSHTIQDVFIVAFISGLINANAYNVNFKCIENKCDSDCDNCDVTKFIKIHELSKEVTNLYQQVSKKNKKKIKHQKFD